MLSKRMPRALIDAKINAALQQRCYHAMLTTAFEKVAQDVIDLNRCAFAQIAIHRRGQRRSGRRQRAGILFEEGFPRLMSACGRDRRAFLQDRTRQIGTAGYAHNVADTTPR